MTPEEYGAFTEALRRSLEADPRVLGLVAVGSMAERETRPDAWSDHDFLVVVSPGAQEEMRNDVSWLPDRERVAYRFRETAHGVKLLYEHGHMLEFAVFDPDELYLGRFNRYRVLLDRADLARRMEEIAGAAGDSLEAEARDDAYLLGQLLTNVLVAYGRWVRGERLSARSFLGQAVTHLVRLLARYVPASSPALLDNLDPLRRFELGYGALGAALNEVLDRPLPAAASGLLELARQELSGRMPGFPDTALAAVRRRCGWSS
jgi:hypothetical protein